MVLRRCKPPGTSEHDNAHRTLFDILHRYQLFPSFPLPDVRHQVNLVVPPLRPKELVEFLFNLLKSVELLLGQPREGNSRPLHDIGPHDVTSSPNEYPPARASLYIVPFYSCCTLDQEGFAHLITRHQMMNLQWKENLQPLSKTQRVTFPQSIIENDNADGGCCPLQRGSGPRGGSRLKRTSKSFLFHGDTQLIVLAVCTGVGGGLAAVLFRWLISVVTDIAFGGLGNLLAILGRYYVILVPALGGAACRTPHLLPREGSKGSRGS